MGRFVQTLSRSVGRRIDEVERASALRHSMMSSDREGTSSTLGRGAISAAIMAYGGAGAEPLPLAQASLEAGQDLAMLLDNPDEDNIPVIARTLPEVSDDRFFSPEVIRPLRRADTRPVRRLEVAPAREPYFLPHGVRVPAKASVIMCIRRHARRGVILALGQGGGYHRKPRRSPTSDIWC